jgi:large subunit ribosomal protein L25
MSIKLIATTRTDLGKGASRRLRHADLVPAIVYGSDKAPVSLTFEHKEIMKTEAIEAFYSSILDLEIDGVSEQVVLKDIQRHAFKARVQHLDLLRVDATSKLHTTIPLHFINEDSAEAVKNGGVIAHTANEIEVLCLPADLPAFIEVDVATMAIGDTLHLSDLTIPAGVESVELNKGASHDLPVVSISLSKTAPAEDEEEEVVAAAE